MGVIYCEVSKAFGFANTFQVLGLAHPHLLVDASVISDIGKMNGMISGLAGISHIALGLFLIFVSFLRGNKEHNETSSLAQVNFADISQNRIFINNKSCNLYFYFVLSINFLL